MTDGRISRLACTATVITRTGDEGRLAALTEGLLRTALPAALPEALEHALAGDPTVYVARSLHCEISAGPAVTGAALARAVAAQLASAVRDPDRDSTGLVRFPSTADYLAAFLAALVCGDAWQRWYFRPLRRLAQLTPPAAFLALDAEGNDMARVLLALHRAGELRRVAAAVGEQALAESWPSSRLARSRQAEWLSLVRLALDLARVLGWDTVPGQDPQTVAAGLARSADADLDWADPVALARALARAVRLVASPGPAPGEVSPGELPPWLDWTDAGALAASLSVRPGPALPAGASPRPAPVAGRPPRTVAAEAVLARLVSSGAVVLDRENPVMTSVTLWAALLERMPELAEAAWFRDAVTRYVGRELTGHGGIARSSPSPAHAPAGPAEPSAVADLRCAGVYLLLRTLDAIRMPRLCQRSDIPVGELLTRLVRRWAGPYVTADDVAAALRPIAGDDCGRRGSPTAAGWQRLQAEVARAVLAQHPGGTGAMRLRAIPFGDAAMALVLGDADDLMWPGGRVRGPAGSAGELLDWWHEVTGDPAAPVDSMPGDADDPGRPILLAALAAVAHGHDGDPETDLALDLIALIVVRHWARWLRGFAAASVPYLLETFVRRPGRLVAAGDDRLEITLDRQAHDVVLDMSGSLAAFDLTWAWRPVPAGPDAALARADSLATGRIRRIEFSAGS